MANKQDSSGFSMGYNTGRHAFQGWRSKQWASANCTFRM